MTAISTHPAFSARALAGLVLVAFWSLQSCGPSTSLTSSALEDDELYLSPGESFTTDAEYMAFALSQAGLTEDGLPSERASGDDYYDPNRAARSMNAPSYSPNFGLGSPYYGNGNWNGNGFGNGWGNGFGMGTGWGNSAWMPSAYFGMGSPGFSAWNSPFYSPWNSGWGSPVYGYPGYGYPGYGYPSYGNGYWNGYGGGNWWGTSAWDGEPSGNGVISGLRVPLSTNTGNNSSYNGDGLYARPRSLADPGEAHPGEVRPAVLMPADDSNSPTTSPSRVNNSHGIQRIMETPSIPTEIREPASTPNRFNVDPSRYNPPAAQPSSRPSTSPSRPSSPSYDSPSRGSTSPSRSSGSGSSPSRSTGSRRP